MGFKSLGLQMLPWCFHMVHKQQQQQHEHEQQEHGGVDVDEGGTASSTTSTSSTVVRVVGSDGRVQVYRRPVSASELMREFPRHLVCHSDSFFIGQKVPPLSEEEQLQPGRSYFLLPAAFFHSVLTFVTVASSLLLLMMKLKPSTSSSSSSSSSSSRPFDIHKTEKGVLQIRISEEVLMKMSKEEEEEEVVSTCSSLLSRVCSTKELEKEYKQLVVGRKEGRKPRLEAIMEHTSEEEEEEEEEEEIIPLVIVKKRRILRFALIAHLPLLFRRRKKKKRELVLPHTLNLG